MKTTHFFQRPVWHWWAQRLTALAMVPVLIWLMIEMRHIGEDREQLLLWLTDPVITVVIISLTSIILAHAQLGIRVIVEDYIADEKLQKALFFLNSSGLVGGIGILLSCFFKLHFLN